MRSIFRLAGAAALALALHSPALAGTLTLKAADGVSVRAETFGSGTQGVVMVHEEGKSRGDWSYLAGKLGEAGYRVVTLDLRGHGDSSLGRELTEEDYPAMVGDVQAAVDWLERRGAKDVFLIGSALGANLSVLVAAEEPSVKNLVLISPGMNLHGVKPTSAMTAYGKRPAMILHSEADEYAAKTARFLMSRASGDVQYEVVPGDATGVRLINRTPGLEDLLTGWLSGASRRADTTQKRAVETGSDQKIETKGVKLGE